MPTKKALQHCHSACAYRGAPSPLEKRRTWAWRVGDRPSTGVRLSVCVPLVGPRIQRPAGLPAGCGKPGFARGPGSGSRPVPGWLIAEPDCLACSPSVGTPGSKMVGSDLRRRASQAEFFPRLSFTRIRTRCARPLRRPGSSSDTLLQAEQVMQRWNCPGSENGRGDAFRERSRLGDWDHHLRRSSSNDPGEDRPLWFEAAGGDDVVVRWSGPQPVSGKDNRNSVGCWDQWLKNYALALWLGYGKISAAGSKRFCLVWIFRNRCFWLCSINDSRLGFRSGSAASESTALE